MESVQGKIVKVLKDAGGKLMSAREIYDAGTFEYQDSVYASISALVKDPKGPLIRYGESGNYKYSLNPTADLTKFLGESEEAVVEEGPDPSLYKQGAINVPRFIKGRDHDNDPKGNGEDVDSSALQEAAQSMTATGVATDAPRPQHKYMCPRCGGPMADEFSKSCRKCYEGNNENRYTNEVSEKRHYHKRSKVPPLMEELLSHLPEQNGKPWTKTKRDAWISAMTTAIDLLYPSH